MGIKEELLEALGGWAKKLDEPSYKERFADFDKTMQFDFTDLDLHILMVFKDQSCTVKEGAVANPDVSIETESDIILGISDGEVSPTKAFMGGKIKAKGNYKDGGKKGEWITYNENGKIKGKGNYKDGGEKENELPITKMEKSKLKEIIKMGN